jgi:hypothetical protein
MRGFRPEVQFTAGLEDVSIGQTLAYLLVLPGFCEEGLPFHCAK